MTKSGLQQIGNDLIAKYRLNSTLCLYSKNTNNNYGYYEPLTDTIHAVETSDVLDFQKTVLHEIKHALDAKRLGASKFNSKYNQAGTIANAIGKDIYYDNKWEKKADAFSKKEINKIVDRNV